MNGEFHFNAHLYTEDQKLSLYNRVFSDALRTALTCMIGV